MKPCVFEIPVFSFRRIETPFERKLGKNYLAVVDARNIPDLSAWRDINVRDPKVRGRVPQAIRKSFDESPEEFLFKNRGLVVAAEKVEYNDDLLHQKVVRVTMKDPAIHGLLDGGHSWRVTRDAVKTLEADASPRYMKIEFITGFDRDAISDVVEARNTSNQVRDESLANLREEFEQIKQVLRDQPYFDQIAWSEYEELESGKPKPIDVRDIISFLITFDTGAFNSTQQPLIAYKDKRACLKHFQTHGARIKKVYPLLPEILRLWDQIHDSWRTWYGEGREEEAGVRGRFGKLTAIIHSPEHLHFAGKTVKYRMPEAYKYPILNAMRAVVKNQGRGTRWSTDPSRLLEQLGPQLTAVVGNAVRATNNPNKVGKDVGIWSSCYLVVESAIRGTMTAEAEKRIEELEAELASLRRSPKT
jgi:AIPR protein